MPKKRIRLEDDLSKPAQNLKDFFLSKFQGFSEDEKRYVLQTGSAILGAIMTDAIDNSLASLEKAQKIKKKTELDPGKIVFEICEDDFRYRMGREPVNQGEFDKFVRFATKALKDTEHINWDIIYEHVKEGMKE